MKVHILLILFLVLIFSCNGKSGSETTDAPETNSSELPSPDPDNASLKLPQDFGAIIVADNLGRARHLAVDDKNRVYVKLGNTKNGNGIMALVDNDQDGRSDSEERFGNFGGTDIKIHNGYLYASSDDAVYRWKMPENGEIPQGDPETIISDFHDGTQHKAKPMAFDKEGNLYVHNGAPSNACMEKLRTPGSPGQDPCPQLEWFGGVWKFDADKPNQKQEDGELYATGIRHFVGMHWNDEVNSLYAVQHGRDQLHQFYPDMYTEQENADLPAEEFFKIEMGDDFGWPYCYYDQFKNQKVLAPEYGGDSETIGRCADKKHPIMAFPGHFAPNDLLFYTGDQFPERYKNGAFVAFHGSWNRAPLDQAGYLVAFVPFKNGEPAGEWEVFANGFAGTKNIESPGDADYRPCGLAQGPDGSLYVADDVQGRIYRICYYGE
ncbi:MAG TPA: sorbosone dehydrogenase [Cytophagales bacterium]|jgi:glucose/arabinose dehydrogenase|nr:sorbosone dehydrogenase [Cytophagales bacterium]